MDQNTSMHSLPRHNCCRGLFQILHKQRGEYADGRRSGGVKFRERL